MSLSDDVSGATQSAILKAMRPSRRWEIARSLYWSARRLKTAFAGCFCMADPDLLALFVRPFEALGVRYMVSGRVAAMLFGEPRLTLAVALVVFLTDLDVQRLPGAFPAAEYDVPPPEVMRVEAAREQRGHFNLIHVASGMKADIYCANSDPLHHWAIARARSAPVGGFEIVVAPPEYVIVRKLEYFREGGSEKHVRDIRRPRVRTIHHRFLLEPRPRSAGR